MASHCLSQRQHLSLMGVFWILSFYDVINGARFCLDYYWLFYFIISSVSSSMFLVLFWAIWIFLFTFCFLGSLFFFFLHQCSWDYLELIFAPNKENYDSPFSSWHWLFVIACWLYLHPLETLLDNAFWSAHQLHMFKNA